jgi:hypothetical protein
MSWGRETLSVLTFADFSLLWFAVDGKSYET